MKDASAPTVYTYLPALRRFVSEAGGSFDLSHILSILERVLVEYLSVPAGIVLTYSSDADTLSLLHQWGLDELQGPANTVVGVSDSAWFDLVQGPFDPVRISVDDSPFLSELFPDMTGTLAAYPFALFFPLVARNRFKGVLGLFSTFAEDFHSNVYELFALQLGCIWDRADLYQRAHRDQRQLRRVIRQVILSQEEERRRVSRELHDEAGQLLTALKLSLEMGMEDLEALLDGEVTAASALDSALDGALNLTEQTLNQVQGLIHEMRPSALDDLGLVTALDSYVRDFGRQRPELSISFHQNGTVRPRLATSAGITLYRFLQEVLENVLDNSQVDTIRVVLQVDGDSLSLSVSENSSGFSPEAFQDGLGLLVMRERLRMEGGRLEVRTDRRERSTLLAFVPIQADQ